MLTVQAFEALTARIKSDMERYSGSDPRIIEAKPLGADHPDRYLGSVEYVGTVKVHYKKNTHTWEIIYGITSAGDIHTWMD